MTVCSLSYVLNFSMLSWSVKH